MAIKTVAELKRRIKPDVYLTLTACDFPHKFMGTKRPIHSVNSVGFSLWVEGQDTGAAAPSYMDWPKASEFKSESDNTFKIDTGNGQWITYEITND